MSTDQRAVDAGLRWLDEAVSAGCPDWQYQSSTRTTIRDVLRHTRDEAGPDAAQAVAERLVTRARAGRPPSATQARAEARDVLREQGVELSMASPLARSNNG